MPKNSSVKMLSPDRFVTSDGQCRFLTFRREATLYALPAEEVAEVIRIPPVARLPHGPKCLLGVANLRGAVLPVAVVTTQPDHPPTFRLRTR